MHGRKRPFTEKNGDIRRSYTNTAHGPRIRCEMVRNGFRIRSYMATVYRHISPCATVYGRIRLQYVLLFRFTLGVGEYINSKCFCLFCFPFCILDYFQVIIRRTISIFFIYFINFYILGDFDPRVPQIVNIFLFISFLFCFRSCRSSIHKQ